MRFVLTKKSKIFSKFVKKKVNQVIFVTVTEIMPDDRVHKGQKKLNMFTVLDEQIKSLSSKRSKLKPTKHKICIFMAFLDSNSHLTTKPSNFDIKFHINFESYGRHSFCGTKFRVGPNFFIYGGRFFQGERVLWGWIPRFSDAFNLSDLFAKHYIITLSLVITPIVQETINLFD